MPNEYGVRQGKSGLVLPPDHLKLDPFLPGIFQLSEIGQSRRYPGRYSG